MKRLLTLVFGGIVWCSVLSAQQIYFNNIYTIDSIGCSTGSVLQTSDSGFFFIANNYFQPSYSIVRTNKFGDTLFSKTYFAPTTGWYLIAIGTQSIIEGSDNNYIAVGTVIDSTGSRDGFVVKFDPTGDTIWTRRFGGAGFDALNSLDEQSNGELWIAGTTDSWGNGQRDFWLVALNSSGTYLWDRTYGGTVGVSSEEALCGQGCSDGGYLLSGKRNSYPCVAKVDSIGNLEWMYTYMTFTKHGWAVQLNDSEYLVASCKRLASNETQACLFKFNDQGTVLWERNFGFPNTEDVPYTLPVISSDGITLAGESGTVYNNLRSAYFAKTDLNGYMQWQRLYTFPTFGICYFRDVKRTSDRGYVLSGSAVSGYSKAWIIKLDSLGCDSIGCDGVGIAEPIMNKAVSVYPNPASTQITFQFETSAIRSIIIADQFGRDVWRRETGQGTIEFPASDFPAGMYFYRVEEAGTVKATGKIIVE